METAIIYVSVGLVVTFLSIVAILRSDEGREERKLLAEKYKRHMLNGFLAVRVIVPFLIMISYMDVLSDLIMVILFVIFLSAIVEIILKYGVEDPEVGNDSRDYWNQYYKRREQQREAYERKEQAEKAQIEQKKKEIRKILSEDKTLKKKYRL